MTKNRTGQIQSDEIDKLSLKLLNYPVCIYYLFIKKKSVKILLI